MSSPFSYDLDERQIKIILQHAELEYNEEAWHNFEALTPIENKFSYGKSMPSINIGISRSIIVPIIFIVLIGGFSTLLFSFVDFKKKPEVITEVPMIIPHTNLKVKPKPIIAKVVPVAINTIVAIPTPTVSLLEEKIKVKPEEIIIKEPEKMVEQKITESKPREKVIKEKKKRKLKSVELPIIKASTTNLNESSVEPELELR